MEEEALRRQPEVSSLEEFPWFHLYPNMEEIKFHKGCTSPVGERSSMCSGYVGA